MAKILQGVACMILMALSVKTHAALIDKGNTTLDSDTGLVWLDLSETVERTYTDISSQLGVGGEFEGYRYATRDETEVFFNNAGVIGVINGYNDFNYLPITGLSDLLGIPLIDPLDRIGGIYDEVNNFNNRKYWALQVNHEDLTGVIGSSSVHPDLVATDVGHFLVKAVPLPAAVWLFGVGLIALLGLARKR